MGTEAIFDQILDEEKAQEERESLHPSQSSSKKRKDESSLNSSKKKKPEQSQSNSKKRKHEYKKQTTEQLLSDLPQSDLIMAKQLLHQTNLAPKSVSTPPP